MTFLSTPSHGVGYLFFFLFPNHILLKKQPKMCHISVDPKYIIKIDYYLK